MVAEGAHPRRETGAVHPEFACMVIVSACPSTCQRRTCPRFALAACLPMIVDMTWACVPLGVPCVCKGALTPSAWQPVLSPCNRRCRRHFTRAGRPVLAPPSNSAAFDASPAPKCCLTVCWMEGPMSYPSPHALSLPASLGKLAFMCKPVLPFVAGARGPQAFTNSQRCQKSPASLFQDHEAPSHCLCPGAAGGHPGRSPERYPHLQQEPGPP